MKFESRHSPGKHNKPVKSLIKALRILGALGDCPGGLGITELSGILKSPKSTVHRLVATLETVGYVFFDLPTSKYVLGSRVAKLGEQLSQQSPLLTFGVPALEQLTRECKEASHLAIMEGAEVVYISHEEIKEPIRISFGMGHRAPVYCTAGGKVFLAGLSNSEILTLYKNKRKKFEQRTPRTLTRLQDLLSEIATVRKEGIAYDNEEYMPGLCCIAAPVRDFSSRTIAAISLSMMNHRMTAERKVIFKETLLRVSAELSEKLGFLPSLPSGAPLHLINLNHGLSPQKHR
ncbi:MAG TPA: IclR family transcriptional regulator [Candidatus Angelobacter sp.]